jgi:hypothetical protein
VATPVQAVLAPAELPGRPSLSIQCHPPVLVVGIFLVEALIMGLHVAQAGIVIGINKGEMNLDVEDTEADVRGLSW